MEHKRLSHYDIVEKIGEGGMGEVFRARDTKLGRDVALKLLPDAFASDPERLARFEREARLLASLNHPNIAAIYGIEQDGDQRFLVLELVEGPDLSERIRSTGRIPVDEALAISKQVCEALEVAHEQGVVHRDLKPANIKVTPDGTVKVLDFGLAKALDTETMSNDLSNSPTVMASSPTMAGVILGTAPYMSPEQARGSVVDKRADVFAFGCVLFEMLTGTIAFQGDTVSDTLASVLAREPDMAQLPASTPRAVRGLLDRCLDKDLKRRLRDIGEARILIEDILAGKIVEPTEPAAAAVQTSGKRASVVPWIVAAIFAVAAVATWFVGLGGDEPGPVTRLAIPSPEGAPFSLNSIHPGPVAISPDGRKITFAARHADGRNLLWVRFLDETEARPLNGTDNAGYPFWSPDSRSIGFFVSGSLRKVEATGGPPFTICDAQLGKGGTWTPDGMIVFAPTYNDAIYIVNAAGGEATPITELNTEEGHNSHRNPWMLPDGVHFLYFARASGVGGQIGSHIRIASADGTTDERLFDCRSQAVYASGHILFVRETTLMARPFDVGTLQFTGDPRPVADPVRFLTPASRGIFSVSDEGTLVYLPGSATPGAQLVWRDREGNDVGILGDRAVYSNPQISPDEKSVVVEVTEQSSGFWDLWVIDVEREVRTRFTSATGHSSGPPAWSPDGSQVVYRRTGSGVSNLYMKSFGGADTAAVFRPNELIDNPFSWSSDGRYILSARFADSPTADLWAIPADTSEQEFAFMSTEFNEIHPRFSPDGKWVAFASNESGRIEVYVAPFPGPGRRYQISSNGALQPRWRGDGRELFYQALNGRLHAVDIEYIGGGLAIGAEIDLMELSTGEDYDVSDDGQRFLVVSEEGQVTTPLAIALNWTRLLELKR